ncbi:MAG: hypothetical protein AVDCRST_MAG68-500 [uncultured Gemmatimonadetes bacterium]|uniref:Uncharacterized protein n=1 Tax=uncultured Gemmatimonadota bacterium TaxID=203437 RepID=A0A6J4KD81_9BACT|nr:MAG: hypothetical protein AVDCRST_MAG68-500 [uncultured Gemmatimonadota bacterium]
MKPPRNPLSRIAARNVESVQAEIAQEKAASLARMATRLQDALNRLEAHDAPEGRPALVAQAGEALWYYVIQREACGLRGMESILREFRVPREVQLRMGPAPK